MSVQRAQNESVTPSHLANRHGQRGYLKPLVSVLYLILIAGLIVSLWSAVRLRPWAAYPVAAERSTETVMWSNVDPVGVNTFLSGEVEAWKRERTMAMVADLGAGWIRQGFAWSEIEPERGQHWDAKYQQDSWAKFDEIVRLAEEYGVRIIARLDQTPAWARPVGTTPAHPPERAEDFGNFVYEFVTRYRGRVSFIQIWNEPNLAAEWGGSIDPAGYAELLDVAARRAREANPNIVILSAPMAMTTENSGRAMDEFSYWQALYDLGISDSFDVISANVYGLADRFDVPPDEQRLNVRRVELLRDLAVRNGDAHKAIWFGEYGWNAAPADFAAERLIWSRVDEARQAEWTADGIGYAWEQWDWFGVAGIWYFRQVGNISPDRADYYFRMVDLEFTPRDVYRLVRESAHDGRVASPGTYAPLEAPVTAKGSWHLIQTPESPDGYYLSGEDGAVLEIRFRGSELNLHLIPEQSSGDLSVAVVDGPDTRGSAGPWTSIALPDATGLAVTEGLVDDPSPDAPAVRTAIIRVAPGSRLAIEGFDVRYDRSYTNLIAGGVVALVAGAGLVTIRRQTGVRS